MDTDENAAENIRVEESKATTAELHDTQTASDFLKPKQSSNAAAEKIQADHDEKTLDTHPKGI